MVLRDNSCCVKILFYSKSLLEVAVCRIAHSVILLISLCAQVLAGDLYIGDHSDAEEYVVSGADPILSTDNVFVGFGADGNSLSILMGGTLSSANARIGFGSWPNAFPATDSASYNSVLVSGYDSTWTCNRLVIGEGIGISNTLAVADGGLVSASSCIVGKYGTSGHRITVRGIGSSLSLNDDLIAGYRASGNRVIIDGGASVDSAAGTIGFSDDIRFNGDGNTVELSGGWIWLGV